MCAWFADNYLLPAHNVLMNYSNQVNPARRTSAPHRSLFRCFLVPMSPAFLLPSFLPVPHAPKTMFFPALPQHSGQPFHIQ